MAAPRRRAAALLFFLGGALAARAPLAAQLRDEAAQAASAPLRGALSHGRLAQALQALLRDVALQVLGLVSWPPAVASCLGDGLVALWRGEGWEPRLLRGHTARVTDVKFLPRGDKLITGSVDGTSIVWDALSGKALHRLVATHKMDEIYEVQVFPDGEKVVVLGAESGAVIWHAATAEALQRLRPRSGSLDHRMLRLLRGGGRVVTGASFLEGVPAVAWEVSDGEVAYELWHSHDCVRYLEASPCGEKVVTIGYGGVFIWSASTGRLERELPMQAHLASGVAISPGGARILVSIYSGAVLVWNAQGTSTTVRMPGGVSAFAFLPGGDAFVLGPSSAVVVDARTGAAVRRFDPPFGSAVQRVAVAGEVVAACGGMGRFQRLQRVAVWNTSSGGVLHKAVARFETVITPDLVSPPPCSVAVGPPWTLAGALGLVTAG